MPFLSLLVTFLKTTIFGVVTIYSSFGISNPIRQETRFSTSIASSVLVA